MRPGGAIEACGLVVGATEACGLVVGATEACGLVVGATEACGLVVGATEACGLAVGATEACCSGSWRPAPEPEDVGCYGSGSSPEQQPTRRPVTRRAVILMIRGACAGRAL